MESYNDMSKSVCAKSSFVKINFKLLIALFASCFIFAAGGGGSSSARAQIVPPNRGNNTTNKTNPPTTTTPAQPGRRQRNTRRYPPPDQTQTTNSTFPPSSSSQSQRRRRYPPTTADNNIDTTTTQISTPISGAMAADSGGSSSNSGGESAITIASNVPGADVYVDDKPVGKIDDSGKISLVLARGQRMVQVTHAGYFPSITPIIVYRRNQPRTFNLRPMNATKARNRVSPPLTNTATNNAARGNSNNGGSGSGDAGNNKNLPSASIFSKNINPANLTAGRNTTPSNKTSGNVATNVSTSSDDKPSNSPKELAYVEDVFARYADPSRSESVKAEDWQRVIDITDAELSVHGNDLKVKSRNYFAQGQRDALRNKNDDALVSYKKAVETFDNSPLYHYALGDANYKTKNFSGAQTHFAQAIKIDPKFALAQYGMGRTLAALNNGRLNSRINAYFQEALRLGLSSPELSLQIARSKSSVKKYEESNQILEAIPPAAQTSEMILLIGDNYSDLKRLRSASDAYLRAMQLDAQSPLAAYRYGEAMFKQNEFATAAEALQKAVTLNDTSAQKLSSADIKRARALLGQANNKSKQ